MRFKEWFLTEIFNSPVPIQWTKTTHADWNGAFVVGDKKYFINMVKDKDMPWEISFELAVGRKRSQEITGTGDATIVFSTVLEGIRQWMELENPDSFVLSAREPNRQSLYRRMLAMLPKRIWDVEDLGSTFFVSNKTIQQPAYSGYSDNDFSDYIDDDYS